MDKYIDAIMISGADIRDLVIDKHEYIRGAEDRLYAEVEEQLYTDKRANIKVLYQVGKFDQNKPFANDCIVISVKKDIAHQWEAIDITPKARKIVEQSLPAKKESKAAVIERKEEPEPAIVLYNTIDDEPTLTQYTAYTKAYDYFNEALFDKQLPKCLLNLSRKSKQTVGFFAPRCWERDGIEINEISLNPQHLGRTPKETFSTLVHEMVHLWQQEEGTPSRANYHNAEWGSKMDVVGLTPSNTGQPGGKRTGQSMTHIIVPNGRFDRAFGSMPDDALIPWLSSMPESRPKKPSLRVKYHCPDCGNNAWGKPDLKLICGTCETAFIS